jgi:hypothetical protein
MALRSCTNCKAGESSDLQLLYCATCQSALYCSKACQREDWKKQHKQICKSLNVGHGGMQVRDDMHTDRSVYYKERFERERGYFDEGAKRFFKLFQESTFEGSRAAAKEMKKYAKRQIKTNQRIIVSQFELSHSLLRFGEAFVAKQSSSRDAPARGSQCAVLG